MVFDLDETLVHATEKTGSRDTQQLASGFDLPPYFVFVRPYVEDVLRAAAQRAQIGIWTSSGEQYAQAILDRIVPADVELSFVWTRSRCTLQREPESQADLWLKDLKKLRRRGWRLERVLMVDDSPEKLHRQRGNLLRMHPFEGAADDIQLWLLARVLPELLDNENLRQVDKRGWAGAARARFGHP